MPEHKERDAFLKELIRNTERFIKLADDMYRSGRITFEEYTDMTLIKKDLLSKAKGDFNALELLQRYKDE